MCSWDLNSEILTSAVNLVAFCLSFSLDLLTKKPVKKRPPVVRPLFTSMWAERYTRRGHGELGSFLGGIPG